VGQFTVACLRGGPAHQRGVTKAGDLIQSFGQLPHQMVTGLPGQHPALVRLRNAQQAQRGDRPVPDARPCGLEQPAAAGLGRTGHGEHELPVCMLRRQPEEGDAEEPFEQGSALAIVLGYQGGPTRWQGHLNAAWDGHRRPSERSVIGMYKPQPP
jgi:hypothetical protein